MKEHLAQFVERMGVEAEKDGLPRIAGRILGYLITAEAPASLATLAGALQVSLASVSTNCRLLETLGAAERISLPGDRRDYYLLIDRFPERFFDHARTKSERKVSIAAVALRHFPSERHVARDRLELWHEFHSFILSELAGIEERWRNRTRSPAPERNG